MTDAPPAYSDDRALVNAVLSGRSGAFERLVREHQTLCWHIVLKLVRDRGDAEDLCQETFLRVHRYLDQYRFDSALRTWIGRIAYSVALRHLERRRLPLADEPAFVDDADGDGGYGEALDRIPGDDDPQARSEQTQIDALLRRQMDRLPPIQSLLLTLYHLDELTIPEISATTGLPSGTIKSHLFRARARLRDALATALGEAP
ncbi:MAG: sigma-70 family RNA polymerase sigma factor [Lysobacter sp.]|nr:MAG: sigma-70 family RNA polymerase sigma factor [Lysobacter sp.]